jgi:putative ABC transport system ATP-binding protein
VSVAESSARAPAASAGGGARVVVRDVRREHPGGIVSLAGVSLELVAGEFVALTGPSGSGKTSLLTIIGALDEPSSGRVEVDGEPIVGGRARARYHRDVVGFVFQHHHLVARLSAAANVELPMVGTGLARRERRRRAAALLDEVGLGHRVDARAAHLSGGERQRVAVARALVTRPALVLADEPTANLDSQTGETIIDLMREMNRRDGTTFVFSTHDAKVMAHASAIVRIADGKIVGREALQEVAGGVG